MVVWPFLVTVECMIDLPYLTNSPYFPSMPYLALLYKWW
jgi:hypothetical protein